MAENRSELNISGVNISESRNGIPLQGWENVGAALKLYESGASGSRTAMEHDVKAYGDSFGGLGAALFLLGNSQDRGNFVESLLRDAALAVQNGGRWQRSYDYDGPGRFHKASVEIRSLPELSDGYLLGLSAAYVGKEVEDKLAETLGIEKGLQWKNVTVTLAPEGDQFAINYDAVVERLQSVLPKLQRPRGSARLTGPSVVKHILNTSSYGYHHEPLSLGIKEGVEVTLQQEEVGDRYNMDIDRTKKHSLWTVERGATLRGPLGHVYRDESKLIPPSLRFGIERFDEERYNRLPAVDPKMKATMNDLAGKIAASFK